MYIYIYIYIYIFGWFEFSINIYIHRGRSGHSWPELTFGGGRGTELNSNSWEIRAEFRWRTSIWPIRNQGYATRCLGKRCFFWRKLSRTVVNISFHTIDGIQLKSQGIQLTPPQLEFSWIPGNPAEFPGLRRKNQEASIKFVMCPRALWSNLLQQLNNTSANVEWKIQI